MKRYLTKENIILAIAFAALVTWQIVNAIHYLNK